MLFFFTAGLLLLCGCAYRTEYVCFDGTVVSDKALCPRDSGSIVCNKPYISFATSCCLDINANSICDGDEGIRPTSSMAPDYVLQVRNKERRNLTVSGITTKDVDEKKDLIFTVHLRNSGNVELFPNFHIDVMDSGNDSDVLKSIDYSGIITPPMSEKDVTIIVVNDLLPGDYLVRFVVYLHNQTLADQRLAFSVRQDPNLPQGRLEKVEVDKVWANPGDRIKITAYYTNDGFVKTAAVFKGRVVLGTRTVAILESEPVEVPSGEQGRISVYFTPEYPGRYEIEGNIYYSDKVTWARSTILNVRNPA